MDAYLFVHFTGTESSPEHEQIYFSVSKDGRNWDILNDGKPVLVSNVGEKGIRDPYIIRSSDGRSFYIIGTDLSIYRRMQMTGEKEAWRQSTNASPDNPNPGSTGMVVFESPDLIAWSMKGLVQAAPTGAGCFWAPKCIWDKKEQAYMVVGASKMAEDNYEWLKLYRTYTRDFNVFTEAELSIDLSRKADKKHVFDCTFMESEGKYYRIYKTDRIQMDTADSLNGDWAPVAANIHDLAPMHEGPAICKENGKDSWLLLLDSLQTHGGYQAFYTEKLQQGQFFGIVDTTFPENIKYRHGSLLPITGEEYERLTTHRVIQRIS